MPQLSFSIWFRILQSSWTCKKTKKIQAKLLEILQDFRPAGSSEGPQTTFYSLVLLFFLLFNVPELINTSLTDFFFHLTILHDMDKHVFQKFVLQHYSVKLMNASLRSFLSSKSRKGMSNNLKQNSFFSIKINSVTSRVFAAQPETERVKIINRLNLFSPLLTYCLVFFLSFFFFLVKYPPSLREYVQLNHILESRIELTGRQYNTNEQH